MHPVFASDSCPILNRHNSRKKQMISDKKQKVAENRTRKESYNLDVRFSPKESDVAVRIKILQKDESNVSFAKRCGISESGLRKLLNGGNVSLDTVSKIARANGVRNSWLIGDAPIDLTSRPDEGVVHFEQDKNDGSVSIDHYVEVRGSAGPGAEPHEEAVIKVRVDAQLLRERVGANFKHIKIASVSGDSMEPTLSHGDQVLVDTSCTRFVDNAIYAIQQDEHLRFKRITLKLDGSIIVKSDATPDVETYTAEVAARFFVIGMVIPFKFGRFKV